jgi:fumarate reductase subunit D
MRRLPLVWILFGAVLLLLLVAALVGPPVILRWDLGRRTGELSAADTAGAINQVRSAIVQGVGAVVVLAGAYVAWRQLQHNMRATQTQVESQRAGFLTDRYTRAVDQLASTDETIRVGAIHALDRIAAEAVTERVGVVALLSTYVRVRAHRGWTSLDDPDLPLRSRASDIQAALTTLTHWIEPGQVPPQWLTADIAHTDLLNANLHGCTLWHVRMRDVNLAGADLTGADLRGADLRDAVLDGVDFSGARANRRTWWPNGFEPQAHGISIDTTEAGYSAWPPMTSGG